MTPDNTHKETFVRKVSKMGKRKIVTIPVHLIDSFQVGYYYEFTARLHHGTIEKSEGTV